MLSYLPHQLNSWPKVSFVAWYLKPLVWNWLSIQTFLFLLPKLKFSTVTFFSRKTIRSTVKKPSHLSSERKACPIELYSLNIYCKFIKIQCHYKIGFGTNNSYLGETELKENNWDWVEFNSPFLLQSILNPSSPPHPHLNLT